MVVTGGSDEFDVICIDEVEDDKQYWAYDRAFWDTTYGISCLGQGEENTIHGRDWPIQQDKV